MLNPFVLVGCAALAYVFAVDDNVAPYLLLQIKRLQLLAGRAIWIIRYHPGTPWARYAINRRAWRLATELKKKKKKKKKKKIVQLKRAGSRVRGLGPVDELAQGPLTFTKKPGIILVLWKPQCYSKKIGSFQGTK